MKNRNIQINESRGKAEQLLKQFKSVFTKQLTHIYQQLEHNKKPTIKPILIDQKGIEKLLLKQIHTNPQDHTTSLEY